MARGSAGACCMGRLELSCGPALPVRGDQHTLTKQCVPHTGGISPSKYAPYVAHTSILTPFGYMCSAGFPLILPHATLAPSLCVQPGQQLESDAASEDAASSVAGEEVEPIEHARVRMHELLDEAFALVTPSLQRSAANLRYLLNFLCTKLHAANCHYVY